MTDGGSATTKTRDQYVDFLRAFSLVIVVIWHWVFTILVINESTVSPTNPIGFTRGMWAITWVLQVMPVFFFVGGYTHRLAFDNHRVGPGVVDLIDHGGEGSGWRCCSVAIGAKPAVHPCHACE